MIRGNVPVGVKISEDYDAYPQPKRPWRVASLGSSGLWLQGRQVATCCAGIVAAGWILGNCEIGRRDEADDNRRSEAMVVEFRRQPMIRRK
jgi:hypothetical protein